MAQMDAMEAPSSPENLALLYQGLLTGIVRLQTERQHISSGESFRGRTRTTLQEIERSAISAGHDSRDVNDTHFAVVALLDSVVLHSQGPVRAEWERQTLQEELFGQTDAGEVFFEKLERLRKRQDSERLADILEVFLLCLLLGFQGRYSGARRAELDGITERIERRVVEIRGKDREISPTGRLPSLDSPAAAADDFHSVSVMLRRAALISLAVTVLLFALLFWNLRVDSDAVAARLISQTGNL